MNILFNIYNSRDASFDNHVVVDEQFNIWIHLVDICEHLCQKIMLPCCLFKPSSM